MTDRIHRELTAEDIERIAAAYHAWRIGEEYRDVPGFCMSADLEKVKESEFVLTPGRYVGSDEKSGEGENFEKKMGQLTKNLFIQFSESRDLEEIIKNNLRGLGYEIH